MKRFAKERPILFSCALAFAIFFVSSMFSIISVQPDFYWFEEYVSIAMFFIIASLSVGQFRAARIPTIGWRKLLTIVHIILGIGFAIFAVALGLTGFIP